MAPGTQDDLYVLAFVTTSCRQCAPVWATLDAAASKLPVPLVVVTPSRSMEDEPRARQLTPAGALLHMSSDTWFMYGVAQAGTVMLVRQGPAAPPWDEPGDVLGTAVLGTADLGAAGPGTGLPTESEATALVGLTARWTAAAGLAGEGPASGG